MSQRISMASASVSVKMRTADGGSYDVGWFVAYGGDAMWQIETYGDGRLDAFIPA